ncbi:MAG: alpha-glucan family phosphorylase [Planctomycetes bacterium]|nr:alpha-glucan family phosphorylase [Planctomycetota bacterium]
MNVTENASSRMTRLAEDLTATALYDKAAALASNLWWSWHPEVVSLFRDLDPIRWRQLGHNPIALLSEFNPERLTGRAAEMVLHSRINYHYHRLKEHLSDTRKEWGDTNAGVLGAMPVAYFSAEFGIHESIPTYSGGLGVLSGDHIKSASGLGVPLVGVGLFYSQGYFIQRLNADGYQQEEYWDTKIKNLPMSPAVDADDQPITVRIDTRNGSVLAKVWLMHIGRIRLYLLDCDVEGNQPDDRKLTSRLYGGDERTRIRQGLVLGVGGVKALRALGITPGVYHLNEGHSELGPLEVIRERMHDDGLTFEEALRQVARQTLYTTHTPVPAGHDRFHGGMIEEHLGPLRDQLSISYEQLMGLGRVDPQNEGELFCMTVLGLKLSRRANAVSQVHGHISRRTWAHLWPWREEKEIPIGHITNGVHIPSWLASQMRQLYDHHLQDGWSQRMGTPEAWQNIHNVDPGELWEMHNSIKNLQLSFVRRRVSRQCRRRGESDEMVEAARTMLNPNTLTIGFGHRFAAYERANLIFTQLDRLDKILNDPERPVQLVFAGKAHPKDEPGKHVIQSIANTRHDPRYRDRIAFIEDYEINVCRHMVQGVDVWLSNPRRSLEGCSTSGQKAALNGVLNLSILDGWWAEAYDGSNGFAIDKGTGSGDRHDQDAWDADCLYRTLEDEVVPLYYDRDYDGFPQRWIKRMKHSISSLAWRFSAHRMVQEYADKYYLPAVEGNPALGAWDDAGSLDAGADR